MPRSVRRTRGNGSSLEKYLLSKMPVRYRCLQCGMRDRFPYDAVASFERLRGEDADEPPQFVCSSCGGVLYPEHYKGRNGTEYRIEDVADLSEEPF